MTPPPPLGKRGYDLPLWNFRKEWEVGSHWFSIRKCIFSGISNKKRQIWRCGLVPPRGSAGYQRLCLLRTEPRPKQHGPTKETRRGQNTHNGVDYKKVYWWGLPIKIRVPFDLGGPRLVLSMEQPLRFDICTLLYRHDTGKIGYYLTHCCPIVTILFGSRGLKCESVQFVSNVSDWYRYRVRCWMLKPICVPGKAHHYLWYCGMQVNLL